ncbi:hypothetical protein RI367_001859 [Sorochytrium milnesiophthora]
MTAGYRDATPSDAYPPVRVHVEQYHRPPQGAYYPPHAPVSAYPSRSYVNSQEASPQEQSAASIVESPSAAAHGDATPPPLRYSPDSQQRPGYQAFRSSPAEYHSDEGAHVPEISGFGDDASDRRFGSQQDASDHDNISSGPPLRRSDSGSSIASASQETPEVASPTSPGVSSASLSSHAHSNNSKRKYRRHPRSDPNEPQKPPSAYVVFSNEVRAELKDSSLSFSDLAKIVGDRWKMMDPLEKKHREEAASRSKAEYHLQMQRYKQTSQYKQYQAYLAEFEASAALSGRLYVKSRKR